jgi:hypothetical protein
MENGRFAPTEEGAPQGGVISPLILNITRTGWKRRPGSATSDAVEAVSRQRLRLRCRSAMPTICWRSAALISTRNRSSSSWPSGCRPRGLGFNAAKTQIVHLNQGCDFLGFNIRRYHGKLPLIKPSDHAVRRIRERLRTEMRVLLGSNAASVLHTLTPIVRGWAAYYRIGSPARCSPRWITTCGSCSTNGSSEHTRTSPGGGAWSGTSTGSTAPATTGGSSVTRTPSLPAQVRLDEDRPARDGHRDRLPRRSRPGPLLGRPSRQTAQRTAQRAPARQAQSSARTLSGGAGPAGGVDEALIGAKCWPRWFQQLRDPLGILDVFAVASSVTTRQGPAELADRPWSRRSRVPHEVLHGGASGRVGRALAGPCAHGGRPDPSAWRDPRRVAVIGASLSGLRAA